MNGPRGLLAASAMRLGVLWDGLQGHALWLQLGGPSVLHALLLCTWFALSGC